MTWTYEKIKEDGTLEYLPINDTDGSITGKIILGVKQWFDENPEEYKARGWIKHIQHSDAEIKEIIGDYNPQTQYITTAQKMIDDYTIEDTYNVGTKSEEMLLFEEMANTLGYGSSLISFIGGV